MRYYWVNINNNCFKIILEVLLIKLDISITVNIFLSYFTIKRKQRVYKVYKNTLCIQSKYTFSS